MTDDRPSPSFPSSRAPAASSPPDVSRADRVVSEASARALELDGLLALVAELTATDLGRERVQTLTPFLDRADLEEHQRRFEEAARLVDERPLVGGFDMPLADLFQRLEAGSAALSGQDLVRLGDVLRTSREAAERILEAAPDEDDPEGRPPFPALSAVARELPDVTDVAERIAATLDRRGDVREDASPLLAQLRSTIRGVRDRLYKRLSSYVQEHGEQLSEDTIPMRGGRLVVVLQAGSRGRVKGLTHGRSGSGKSFYFEPLEVVEANNTLQQAVEDEEEEKKRILAELFRLARQALPRLEEHGVFLADLDLLQASHRFAERCGARLAETARRGELVLYGARHPLLTPELADLRRTALGHPGHTEEVVPLDVDLAGERRALVITGPNAGGKTVALKTVGLLALAAQCGLPVPVEVGSRIPFLDALVATVGDEQDLLAERSTFSGRLLRLHEAWEAMGPDALILLDELGSGTDPEEGSALSVALLEGLLESGCLAVITTHLTQVAAAALETDGAGCAAMEFSSSTGEPTYRLLPGPPGASEALALARRLGLSKEWLDRAEERLGSRHRDLRRMLAEVEELRGELAQAKGRAEGEARRLERERRELEQAREEAEAETREVSKRLRKELAEFRRETTRRLADEVERLREEVEAGRRKRLESEAAERLFEEAPELPEVEPEESGPLEEGGRVRHTLLGWEGTLDSLDRERGKAEVTVRGKTLRCGVDELVAVDEPESKKGSKPKRGAGRRGLASRVRAPEVDEVEPELHLLGQRVEPALERLDGYLDRAILGSRQEVRVVHGHGTGRLRDAVREHLDGHPAVASFRRGAQNEGGDGATVVRLRG